MFTSMPIRALAFFAASASALVPAVALLSACSKESPPPKTAASSCTLPISVGVSASERVNPDEFGQPLPTVVRVFQLKRAARAEEADFVELWERPEEALAEDLILKQQVTVFPGRQERIPMELDPKARFLVGMAVFREPTATQWRTVVPLPASHKLCATYKERAPDPALNFSLDGYRIEARSYLLQNAGSVDLPSDVTVGGDRTGDATRSPSPGAESPSTYDVPTSVEPPSPNVPNAPQAPRAPTTPNGI